MIKQVCADYYLRALGILRHAVHPSVHQPNSRVGFSLFGIVIVY